MSAGLREELRKYEDKGILVYREHLCVDVGEDVEFLEGLDPENDAIFYHSSFVDSDAGGNFTGSSEIVDFISELMEEAPYVVISFSDGNTGNYYYAPVEGKPEGASMRKTFFYRHFSEFMRLLDREGRADIRGLVDGFPTSGLETPVDFTDPESVVTVRGEEGGKISIGGATVESIEGMKGAEAIVKAFKSTPETGIVRIETKTLSPVAARHIALLLRLSVRALGRRALLPIIFADGGDPLAMISDFACKSNTDILFAPCSYIGSRAQGVVALTPETYIEDFMPKIKVKPLAEVGNHTIANDWGAYVLGQYLKGFSARLATQDPLYLAYLLAQRLSAGDIVNMLEGKTGNRRQIARINANGKRILLVDDQDDKWKAVAEHLFSNGRISVIGKKFSTDVKARVNDDAASCYLTPEAWDEILSGKYDLILLDLRLGGVREETLVERETDDETGAAKVSEFSGIRVLKKISGRVPGQQVIMFTSSNKAWNMRKAMFEYGASGYYIKESPSQPLSEEESYMSVIQLFNTITDSLDNSYLKDLFRQAEEIRNVLTKGCRQEGDNLFPVDENAGFLFRKMLEKVYFDFCEEDVNDRLKVVSEQIGIGMNMLRQAARSKDEHDYAYAYLALEQVFESLAQLSPLRYELKEDGKPYGVAECIYGLVDTGDDNISLLVQIRNGLIHQIKDKIEAGLGRGINPYDKTGFRKLWIEIYSLFAPKG